MTTKWFSLGIAADNTFCNRIREQKQLRDNIQRQTHSVIISPRRYGKTSLANHVARHTPCIFAQTDFMTIANEQDARKMIFNAASEIILNIMPNYKKILKSINTFIHSIAINLIIDQNGPKLQFTSDNRPEEDIITLLMGLDQLATKENKKAIILFDEFQQISSLTQASSIEGAIRHVAQQTKSTSYIFSGSNRHLLSHIFDDSSKPLYHLCDRIMLDRIHAEDYFPFIQHAAKATWHKPIDDHLIELILSLSKCHPYYVNVLCTKLWSYPSPPNKNSIISTWEEYTQQEINRIAKDIEPLSLNQRALLNTLAKHPTPQPSGHDFLQKVGLPSASVIQAIKMLLRKDFIFYDDNQLLRVLDPVTEYILKTRA